MILPSSHLATLVLVILGMLCWGLWANTFPSGGRWRFELYYFTFAAGAFVAVVVAALTVGTLGFDGFSLSDDILHAGRKQDLMALIGGIIFNLGNMLLVAAIGIAGMATTFPVAMGVSIAMAVSIAFLLNREGNATMIFGGAGVLLVAACVMIYAYRALKLSQIDELVMTGKLKSTRKIVSLRGVIVAAIAGIILAFSAPLLVSSQEGESGLGPYSAAFIFVTGMFLSTLLYNLFFMNLPISGEPLSMRNFFKSPLKFHLLSFAGGVLWCAGLLGTLVAGHAEGPAAMSPAAIYAISQGSAIIAALCGLIVWKDFRGCEGRVSALVFVVIALFICGLGMVSVGPTWTRG